MSENMKVALMLWGLFNVRNPNVANDIQSQVNTICLAYGSTWWEENKEKVKFNLHMFGGTTQHMDTVDQFVVFYSRLPF